MEKTENKLVEPKPENFGWESSTQESAGGWTIEGGEEAYYKALSEYKKQTGDDIDDIDDELHSSESNFPEPKKLTHAQMLEKENAPLRVVTDEDMEVDYHETTKADFEGDGTDNGTSDPIDEKDMEEITAKKVMDEDFIKFVIIGGNEPLVNQYFIDSLSEAKVPVKVYEMTMEEIKFIVNSRAQKQAEKIAVDYLNDESYRKRVSEWILILMQNHIRANFPSMTVEEARRYFDGETELLFTKKTLKEASKLSWSDFEELFNSLKLFNFVKFDEDNTNLFSLTIDEKDIVENQKSELRQILNIGNGVIFNLLKSKHIAEYDAQNLEELKTKILEIIGKI